MREHEYAVPGDGKVGLERRDADLERPGEGGQRILRRQPSGAPVALQIEGACGHGGHHRSAKKERQYSTLPHERHRPLIVVAGRA